MENVPIANGTRTSAGVRAWSFRKKISKLMLDAGMQEMLIHIRE